MEITNIRLVEPSSEGRAKAKEAETRKKAAVETIEDAWVRIFGMKNISATDLARLKAVQSAMQEGLLGREEGAKGKFSKAEALRLYKVLAEMQREQKLSEMVANTPENYVLVTDIQELRKLVGRALYEPEIAVDTETTGLDVYVDVIVGVSLTLPNEGGPEGKHYYIPFKPTQADEALPSEAIQELKPLIETDTVGKVFHNALFDMAMFRRHGLTLRGLLWDTQTAMHVLNENEPSYRLKDLAPKYLGVQGDTFGELFGNDAQFSEIPLDIALVYAAKDTHLTWDFYQYQKHHLQKMPEMYEYYTTVEVPLLYVILDMEDNGYVLDLEFAKAFGQKLHAEANDLHARLMMLLTPHFDGDIAELNLNSGAQLKPVLSKAIGKELPNLDAKKTLKPLRSKHEVIDVLMEYRRLVKLSGTYIDTLPTKQHPVTKRWHSRFNTGGTVTGRFSSGKDEEAKDSNQFNVQNQPEEARKMFVAPPGKVLVGADFKSQEIRCVAYLSGEPSLIKAFKENKDPYANLAVAFTGLPYEQVNKNPDGSDTVWRKKMKVAWLAWLYGASDQAIGEWLGTTKDEAGKFMTELKATLPMLSSWLDGNREFAIKHGFVWMDGKKRKRRLPDAKLKRKQIPYGKYFDPKFEEARKHNGKIGGALRQATNARVQGSSAIQTKVTMIRAHELCLTKPGWKLWGSIHDELLFEVPEDVTREEIKLIEDVMLYSYVFGDVANGTDIEIARRWGEGVPVEEWFTHSQ